MAFVLIALGTNLGRRRKNLKAARRMLAPDVHLRKKSSIHETAAWGFAEQPDFLNQVLLCETDLPPHALLAYLKSIEARLGRKPTFRYGPRLIDLDLLAYEDQVLDTPDLQLPHPRLHERRFVLAPLVEIAPDWVHPRLNRSAEELLNDLSA